MFSIISSNVEDALPATFSKGYKFTATISIFSIFISFAVFWCASLSLIFNIPPCTFGWRVLTLPSKISGEPVNSDTSVTGIPASLIAFAVPPVDNNFMPSSCKPRANSTIPVLSDTLNNA